MTDKELLELAAKAAMYAFRKEISPIGIDLFYVDGHRWNPLTDDGEAAALDFASILSQGQAQALRAVPSGL